MFGTLTLMTRDQQALGFAIHSEPTHCCERLEVGDRIHVKSAAGESIGLVKLIDGRQYICPLMGGGYEQRLVDLLGCTAQLIEHGPGGEPQRRPVHSDTAVCENSA